MKLMVRTMIRSALITITVVGVSLQQAEAQDATEQPPVVESAAKDAAMTVGDLIDEPREMRALPG